MASPAFDSLLDPLLKTKAEVTRMALLRLEYEGLAKAKELLPGGDFYKNKEGFAMDVFSYFMCSKCSRPYFGGRHECGEDLEAGEGKEREWNKDELVCARCVPHAADMECPKHGTQFLEWKCRFCCGVAVFFCFGTTHFCDTCHQRPGMMTGCAKDKLPKCPAGPQLKQLEGKCPLNVKHPPTGDEFALGCGVCRNAAEF